MHMGKHILAGAVFAVCSGLASATTIFVDGPGAPGRFIVEGIGQAPIVCVHFDRSASGRYKGAASCWSGGQNGWEDYRVSPGANEGEFSLSGHGSNPGPFRFEVNRSAADDSAKPVLPYEPGVFPREPRVLRSPGVLVGESPNQAFLAWQYPASNGQSEAAGLCAYQKTSINGQAVAKAYCMHEGTKFPFDVEFDCESKIARGGQPFRFLGEPVPTPSTEFAQLNSWGCGMQLAPIGMRKERVSDVEF